MPGWKRRTTASATAVAVALLGGILSACAPAAPPHGGGATTSARSAPGSPSAPSPAGPAAFDTIDGVWCAASDPTQCMTITLPDVDYGDGPESRLDDPKTDDWAAPCFTSALIAISTGMGEVGLAYCPKDVLPSDPVTADVDDTSFDRIYLTQNPPNVDAYFRKDELAAATG